MSSRSVLRTPKTLSELVTTFMPGSTGRTQEAADARTRVHHAKAANADGSLVLQMAKCGDVDTVHARGIENARAGRYGDGLAVERQVDEAGWCGCSRILGRIPTTPGVAGARSGREADAAGALPSKTCASTSARKCFSTD